MPKPALDRLEHIIQPVKAVDEGTCCMSAEFSYLRSDFLEHVASRCERYEHFPCFV